MRYTGNTTYTITIDPTPQQHKPSKEEIGVISNNLKLVTGLTLNEFINYTSHPYSYTWFGGTFSGNISNINWSQQSVFALDFDQGNIDLPDALYKLNTLEIFPQVWYDTLSSSDTLRKFRIVIFLDEPVTKIEQRNLIADGLLALFPQADQSCKNPCRFFFGGKSFKLSFNLTPPGGCACSPFCVLS